MKRTNWMAVVLATAACVHSPVRVWSQDEPPGEDTEVVEEPEADRSGQEEKPLGWLRILPVGDAPPFRQEIRDGVRVEMPPPPGSVPPRQIAIPVGEKKFSEQRLKLGLPTTPVVAQAGSAVTLHELSTEGARKPWMRVNMPEQSAALAILFRDPREKTWDKVRSLVLQDDVTAFPEGAMRLVNASVFALEAELGTQRFELAPGKVVVRKRAQLGPIEDVPLKLAVRAPGGDWTKIYDSALVQNRGERTNIVIYRADGEKPRRIAKVLVLRERASLPKPPEKPKAPEE